MKAPSVVRRSPDLRVKPTLQRKSGGVPDKNSRRPLLRETTTAPRISNEKAKLAIEIESLQLLKPCREKMHRSEASLRTGLAIVAQVLLE